MKRLKKIGVAVIFFSLCCIPGICRSDSPKKHVLLINSYSKGYAWTDNEVRGIEEVLSREKNIVLKTEYMDAKVLNSPEYYGLLRQVYEKKYGKIQPAVVMTTDDDALNFLKQYRDDLFPDVPVVFCGVNNISDEKLEGFSRYTGVNEAADFKTNLDLILNFHPGTKEIYVINDRLTTAVFLKKEFLKAAKRHSEAVRFVFLENLSMDELLEKVSSLPRDSVLFYLSFFRDKTGQTYTPEEIIPAIRAASSVPVYGAVDYMLGHGIVGGMLKASYFQGETAARLALRVLGGEDVDNLPVVMESPNHNMFDYKELKSWGISLKKLPQGSILINEPESVFYKYRRLFITLAVILSGLVCFIIVLLFNIKKRKRAQKGLQTIISAGTSMINYQSAREFREQITGSLTQLIQAKGKFLFLNYTVSQKDTGGKASLIPVWEDDKLTMETLPRKAAGLIQKAVENKACMVSRKNGVAFFKSSQFPGNVVYLEGEKSLDDLDRDLLDIFANNVTMSIENIEKHKIEESLETAKQIQMSMLPGNFDEFSRQNDLDLHAFLSPAKEVGGDLYDFFAMDDQNLCFLVGDVSDKGVPAALFMAMAKSLIRSAGETNTQPDQIITKVNNILSRDNGQGMFVTVFLAIFNRSTRALSYTSAGHNPPYLVSEASGIRKLTPEPGFVMGGFEDFPYICEQTTLHQDEGLFIYSDGVTEAMNIELEEYGEARLEKILKENAGAASEKLNQNLIADLKDFVGQAPQSDDITLLFVRV